MDNTYRSPHDTAILIDSTGSMEWLIDTFKGEALRLANETFEAGGRVALYDYRDLDDPYEPVARCDFSTCTPENFQELLNGIVAFGGGDEEESLLSASMKVMSELSWQPYATKSLVVLTDAPFLSPDRDATTVEDVIELSKRIDPVNMYIITTESVMDSAPEMTELAEATDGFVMAELGDLNLLTIHIMDRYDTLPRVEETSVESAVPELTVINTADNGEEVMVEFSGSATGAIVVLNDAPLGLANEKSITLTGLDRNIENVLQLTPINEYRKGGTVEIILPRAAREVPVEENEEAENMPEIEAAETEDVAKVENISEAEEEMVKAPTGGEMEAVEILEKVEVVDEGYGGVVVPKAPDTGRVN